MQEWLLGYLSDVLARVAATSDRFTAIQSAEHAARAVPFFGDAETAMVVTVGVNPSVGEFHPGRAWPQSSSPPELLDRLRHYFVDGACPPHPWFSTWERALQILGHSYSRDTIHLDLSPRPTHSMGKLRGQNIAWFREMVERDIPHFWRLLSHLRNVRLVLASGTVTKRDYMLEFLRKNGLMEYGEVTTIRRFVRGGHAPVGLYEVQEQDQRVCLFFGGSGPSSNQQGRKQLVDRIREFAPLLRNCEDSRRMDEIGNDEGDWLRTFLDPQKSVADRKRAARELQARPGAALLGQLVGVLRGPWEREGDVEYIWFRLTLASLCDQMSRRIRSGTSVCWDWPGLGELVVEGEAPDWGASPVVGNLAKGVNCPGSFYDFHYEFPIDGHGIRKDNIWVKDDEDGKIRLTEWCDRNGLIVVCHHCGDDITNQVDFTHETCRRRQKLAHSDAFRNLQSWNEW